TDPSSPSPCDIATAHGTTPVRYYMGQTSGDTYAVRIDFASGGFLGHFSSPAGITTPALGYHAGNGTLFMGDAITSNIYEMSASTGSIANCYSITSGPSFIGGLAYVGSNSFLVAYLNQVWFWTVGNASATLVADLCGWECTGISGLDYD